MPNLEGIKATVTKPIGPLPAFAWVLVIVGGYFGYKFLSGRSGSSGSATVVGGTPSTTTTSTPSTTTTNIPGTDTTIPGTTTTPGQVVSSIVDWTPPTPTAPVYTPTRLTTLPTPVSLPTYPDNKAVSGQLAVDALASAAKVAMGVLSGFASIPTISTAQQPSATMSIPATTPKGTAAAIVAGGMPGKITQLGSSLGAALTTLPTKTVTKANINPIAIKPKVNINPIAVVPTPTIPVYNDPGKRAQAV